MKNQSVLENQQKSSKNQHDIQETLEKYFHLQTFRPNQEAIIQAIVSKRDVFAIMATGGGKSLCYQLPAMMLSGMTVVISPLIALMKDQVDSLLSQGVNVAMLNSSLSYDSRRAIEAAAVAGKIKMLYVSPERAVQSDFVDFLQQCSVSLFAVDEAHCISMWGHQFRPEYRRIKGLRAFFPDVPFAAFTATATRRVRTDIINELKLKTPSVFIGSFDRPNLRYSVYKESKKDIRMKKIASYVAGHKNVSGIIYCFSRADTEEMAEYLMKMQIMASPYHAGMSTRDRARVQEMFQTNRISVVCATIAFGMGIDKPDVRYVIHAHLPKDLESYYQETGRAGRDGLASECLLFYSPGDRAKMLKLVENEGDMARLPAIRERMYQLYSYCESSECRRKILLRYFDQEISDCNNCDNCAAKKRRKDTLARVSAAKGGVAKGSVARDGVAMNDVAKGGVAREGMSKGNVVKVDGMKTELAKSDGLNATKPKSKRRSRMEALPLPKNIEDDILDCIGEMEGMLTVPEFVSFLLGLDRQKTKTLGLNRHKFYGVAKYYQRQAVADMVEGLIDMGKLRAEGDVIQRVYSG